MKNLLYIAALILFLASCEDVIDVDLNTSDPHLVIESTITNQQGPYEVKISRTTDYFNSFEQAHVSDAFVVISDNEGNSDTLNEISPGIYQTSIIEGIIGRTYTLNVNVNGDEYTATSTMPDITPIDYISYDKATAIQGEPEDYYILTYFNDEIDVANYYRLKLYINSEWDDVINITNDEWQDGKDFIFGMLAESPNVNDTLIVELGNIDEAIYEYFNTLYSLMESDAIFGTTPANPNSNISNGALGFFSAYSYVQDTVIIQ